MRHRLLVLAIAFTLAACSSDSSAPQKDSSPSQDTQAPADVADVQGADQNADSATPDEASPHDTPSGDVPTQPDTSTADLTPPPPSPPAPKAYSGGTCPAFSAGKNEFMVGPRKRQFELWIPEKPKGAPLVFIWHGLGDSPKNIAAYFQAQKLATERGAVVVAPYDCCASGHKDCCATPYVWGIGSYASDSDLVMFDDLLACIDQQADIDNTRVYTTGFSAGALWSTHLVVNRGEYLASAGIFSGGTGSIVKYSTPGNKLPVLLAHGGVDDTYAGIVKFDNITKTFAQQLHDDGHIVVLCDHSLGHSVPMDGATWDAIFMFAHQWGDPSSPFADSLSTDFPRYCTRYAPPQ